MFLTAGSINAQEKHVKEQSESQELNTDAYIQLLRADLKSQKQQIVKETMQLDEKQAALFWPVYTEYDTALTKIGDERLAIIQEYAANFMTMTNEKADQLAKQVMALDDQRNELRRKYDEQVSKALSPVLATRFFQVENQIQLLVDLKIAANLPILEGPDQK